MFDIVGSSKMIFVKEYWDLEIGEKYITLRKKE